MVSRNVAAMIHRHATFRIQPVQTKWNHLRHVIPSGVKRSRGIFPSSKLYLVVILPPTWWIPPLRFAAVGMTKRTTSPHMSFRGSECESRNLPELLVLSCVGSLSNVVDFSTPLRCGRNDKPEGGFVYPHRLFLQRFPERHIGRSLRFRWRVLPLRPLLLQ